MFNQESNSIYLMQRIQGYWRIKDSRIQGVKGSSELLKIVEKGDHLD